MERSRKIDPLVAKKSGLQKVLIATLSLAMTALGREPAPSGNYHLGGSWKSIFAMQQLRQVGIFPESSVPLTEQRLRLEARASSGNFFSELATELSLFLQRSNPPQVPLPSLSSRPFWITDWQIIDRENTKLIHRIDRAYLQYQLGATQFIVGKQVIPNGVGHLFNAVSQVPRHSYLFVDAEYAKTEDSVTVLFQGALVLEARFLPRVGGQRYHNFHLRAKGSKTGYDVALTTGRSDDKLYIALEAAGNFGESLLRGEIVGYDQEGRGFLQGLLGLDHVFSETLSGEIEFFYNGFGQRTSDYGLEPFAHRSAPYRGIWYLGHRLQWELTPLLKHRTTIISNLADPSLLFQLSLTYSLSHNIEIELGHYQGLGTQPQSEFGGRLPLGPGLELGMVDLTYALMRWYF